MRLAFMHVHSMRITSGEEALVARALTKEGKVGFGFSFRLDAAEARHMAEWHAGVRKDRPWSSRCSITVGAGVARRHGTGLELRPDLLLWNFCRLHYPAPALRFADEELAQLLGRAGAPLDAELGEALLHVGDATAFTTAWWRRSTIGRGVFAGAARPFQT